MKTSYNNPRRRSPRISPGLWLALGILLLCVLAAAVWRGSFASLLWRAATPFVAARNALVGGEVAQLQAEIASTTAALADRDLLYRENLDLKARLLRNVADHRVLAGVLQRPPATAYDTFIIDAGAASGIKVGDRVFASGGLALGEIVAVYATTARVSLYSSPGATYQASLVGRTGVPVSLPLVGQGGGSFMAQVPAGTDVAVGEPVAFAGTAEALAGTVSAVVQEAGASFVDVYLHLPVNLFALRFVEVQINQNN